MRKLFEYQIDDNIKKQELIQKVFDKLKLSSLDDIDINKVSEFVEDNYDLLVTDVDTIQSDLLLRNYFDFIQKDNFTESLKLTIREAAKIHTEIKLLTNKNNFKKNK